MKRSVKRKAKKRLREFQRGRIDIDLETAIDAAFRTPFSDGPYQLISLTVMRRREGTLVEVTKPAIVNGAMRPVEFGARKWLERRLKKFETGYLKYLMTRGTKAEGL